MALTKQERDALPAEDFAVPETRDLPMHDAKHTKMAWDMVDQTKGLSDAQRAEARRRLLRRAKEQGLDTSDWNKLKSVAFEAMALDVPAVKDHPNRMPFSGILVRLDHPSDKPPGGAGGRRILIPKAIGEKAIPSLLGMGVNVAGKLDNHDVQHKVGIITAAEVRKDTISDFIHVEGFIYASDFPDEAARIRATKATLGMSFEGKAQVADPGADPLELTECVFTGAAILKKSDAAFTTTAIAARADATLEINMDEKKLQEIIAAAVAGAVAPLNAEITALKKDVKAANETQLKAANMTHRVEPHAAALCAAADAMEQDGIGGHDRYGHAAIARRMASHMRASAATGQIPYIYRDHDFLSGADKNAGGEELTKQITDAITAAVTPLKDTIAAQATTIKDLKAAAEKQVQAPERKTLSPEVTALMTKFGLTASADGKLTVDQVDKVLDAQKVFGPAAFETKLKLRAAGVLA